MCGPWGVSGGDRGFPPRVSRVAAWWAWWHPSQDLAGQYSDSWQRYHSQTLLGASLAGQQRYAEAEALLVSGQHGMLQRQAFIPPQNRDVLPRAGQRLAHLYENWGKPEKAAEWSQVAKMK